MANLILKELAEVADVKHSSLEVQDDIKMSQEIEANNAIYAMLFREGIAQSLNVIYFGIGDT